MTGTTLTPGVSAADVRRWVRAVLDGEGIARAVMSVTFLKGTEMRGLNRRALGRDRATDVIAFGLDHVGRVAGDVYVCPSVVRASARQAGIPLREETARVVIHGVLHVLGYEHPDGGQRMRSQMWQTQERYVAVASAPGRRSRS